MNLEKIKELSKDMKKEKGTIAKLLSELRNTRGSNTLAEEITLRMDEMNAFILVLHSALENKDHDETFFTDNVGKMMYLFEERFDELQVMINVLIENTEKKAPVKAIA